MNTSALLNKAGRYLKKESPLILTCASVAGVIATAVMAARATPKAANLCYEVWDASEEDYEPTTLDYVKVAWKEYIPTAIVGSVTITCIISANVLNQRQQAALTSAYILLERSYKSYREKMTELYGEESDRKVRAAIAKDHYEPIEPSSDDDLLLFYEENYGKYFHRKMTEVMDAEYHLNRKFALEGEASINDFLDLLGLEKIDGGDLFGWSQEVSFDFYNYAWIDFEHELITMDDGMECYIISLPKSPTSLIPF